MDINIRLERKVHETKSDYRNYASITKLNADCQLETRISVVTHAIEAVAKFMCVVRWEDRVAAPINNCWSAGGYHQLPAQQIQQKLSPSVIVINSH